MTVTKKLLILLTAPFIVSFVVLAIGVATHRMDFIGSVGVFFLFVSFYAFAFCDKILKWLRSIHSNKVFKHHISTLDARTRHLADLLAKLPIESAILIRGVFLSLSFWIVDLFVALCEGGIWSFGEQIHKNFLFTVMSLTISVFETLRGKTLSRPGVLTRIISTVGALQFFRGLYLLGATLLGPETF